jgi:PIN domain nuclease of toxin-antitoxin system
MNLLLDAHTFIWFVSGDSNLSLKARQEIENPGNLIFFSIASLWEMSLKIKIGKLSIQKPFEEVINDVTENGIEILPISFTHLIENTKLPFHHRDPFDRIIISQSIVENMNIVSRDAIFDKYLSSRIW